MINGRISHWMHDPRLSWPTTSTVEQDARFDVAIVGAGYTGLWTAWWLLQHAPQLSVAVFEARQLGFGASGRNGGWLSSKPVGLRRVLANSAGAKTAILEMDEVLRRSPAEVVGLLGRDSIQARHGGWMQIARSQSELQRLHDYIDTSRDWGVPESSLRMLTAEEAHDKVRAAKVTGAIYSPDGYTVNPALLVRELADRVLHSGGEIFTGARATNIMSGSVTVNGRRATARVVVIATEGYTAGETGRPRRMLPLNSAVLVTDPLSREQWESIGWAGGAGLAGTAHDYFYGQPTADGRILIGGSGRPYRFGSTFDIDGKVDDASISKLRGVLRSLFPTVEMSVAHAWSGVMGVTRDWSPFVDFNDAEKVMRLGGYAGQGVTGAYVAGQIAADLILNRNTQLARCPWVRPQPGNWPPEPLRWVGARTLHAAYNLADRIEQRGDNGRTSSVALIADRLAKR